MRFFWFKIKKYTVIKLNKFQEAHKTKAHSVKDMMMFFSATNVRKSYKAQSNQGSTQHKSTRPALYNDVFFLCNYCQKKGLNLNQIKNIHNNQAQCWEEGLNLSNYCHTKFKAQ